MPPEMPASTKWTPFACAPRRSAAASRGSSSCRRRRSMSPASSSAEQLLERVLGDLARRDHHPERARRVELRRAARSSDSAVRLDAFGSYVSTSCPARAGAPSCSPPMRPRPTIPSLHLRSSSRTRATRRPRSRSAAKSPGGLRADQRPKPNVRPGIGISSPGSSTTWTKSRCPARPCGAGRSSAGSAARGRSVTTQPVARRARTSGASRRSFAAQGR